MDREITSLQNPIIKETRVLGQQRKERETRGLAVVEGVRLAEEAAAAGVEVAWTLYTEALAARERGAAVIQALRRLGPDLYRVPEAVLAKAAATESPQGVLVVFAPRAWTWDELRQGPVLLCDGLTDPGNLGTAIRTAEALGAGGVVLTGTGVDPYNAKVIRATMGSLFRLPVIIEPNPAQAVAGLRAVGYQIMVAEADGRHLPWQADLTGRVAVAVGSEAHGPSAELVGLADGTVRIPMPGPAESLNAGVAASLLLYEALRQRSEAGSC